MHPVLLRGHSSAGRAPALQAGGHRFESGCLHNSRSASAEMVAKRTSGNYPPDWFRSAKGGGSREADARKQSPGGKVPGPRRSLDGSGSDPPGARHPKLYRGKVTRSWRRRSHRRTSPSPLITTRIGDFVLCQGESGSGASLGACDGSNTSCCVRPVVRLMSDRESVSGASTPLFGFCRRGARAPKSGSEGSEAFV
jgi:hypothetical protein